MTNSAIGKDVNMFTLFNVVPMSTLTSGNKSRTPVARNTPAAKQLRKLNTDLYLFLCLSVFECFMKYFFMNVGMIPNINVNINKTASTNPFTALTSIFCV